MPTKLLAKDTTVSKTVRHMRTAIRKAAANPEIQQLAFSFLKYTIPEQAIFNYTYDHIAYIPDEDGFQDIRTPQRSLKDGVGNCVDYAVFIGSMLYVLGIPFKLKVVEIEEDQGYEHIYVTTDEYIYDPSIGQPQDGSANYSRPATGQFNRETFFLTTNTMTCLN